ncbi:MAG: 50S ribosomal protein L15 [Chitinivibrionales bacterium]|nr:50S ribosomal protein L15 [Chitinivibrionales bacterium]
MKQLNTIQPALGSTRDRLRVGRGRGSGQGCTAGYGNNGAKARAGASTKLYYEGGQTPITRRLPKRGFTNRFKVENQIVNVGQIQNVDFTEKEITVQMLFDRGLVHSQSMPVKILGGGEFTKSVTIKADSFSKSALEKIEKAKGKAEVTTRA